MPGSIRRGLVAAAAELVVSPGVAMDDPLVAQARAAGVSVVGDIDLFVREAAAPVVGITGSNAKSTVTELVGQMARDAGLNVGVGGNLGTPALDLLDPERALYVLELSSFQLERARRTRAGGRHRPEYQLLTTWTGTAPCRAITWRNTESSAVAARLWSMATIP